MLVAGSLLTVATAATAGAGPASEALKESLAIGRDGGGGGRGRGGGAGAAALLQDALPWTLTLQPVLGVGGGVGMTVVAGLLPTCTSPSTPLRMR